jgi:hypothetical protein
MEEVRCILATHLIAVLLLLFVGFRSSELELLFHDGKCSWRTKEFILDRVKRTLLYVWPDSSSGRASAS